MPSKNNFPDINKLAGKKVLITGGTGFIGKNLVNTLKDYCDVLVLSRNTKCQGVKTVNADITDKNALFNALNKIEIDLVFHIAGNTITPNHTNDLDHFSINSLGTRNLLELCLEKETERIIYSSSVEVYGNPLHSPIKETHPIIPISYYGMSKWIGEQYCQEFFKQYGLNSTILRYSYVYGPRLPDFRVISRFIKNALEEKPLLLHNCGKSSTDYVFVGDVVLSNILAASNKNAVNQVFNIGSGVETSVEELAHIIINLAGKGCVQHIPNEQNVTKKFIYDISHAKNILKLCPEYSLSRGLKEQMESMNSLK